jgi:hypothetical protein
MVETKDFNLLKKIPIVDDIDYTSDSETPTLFFKKSITKEQFRQIEKELDTQY